MLLVNVEINTDISQLVYVCVCVCVCVVCISLVCRVVGC
jgi:hypothetical protein